MAKPNVKSLFYTSVMLSGTLINLGSITHCYFTRAIFTAIGCEKVEVLSHNL